MVRGNNACDYEQATVKMYYTDIFFQEKVCQKPAEKDHKR